MEPGKLKVVIDRIHMLTEIGDDWISTRNHDAKAPDQTAVNNILEVLECEQSKFQEIIVGPLPCGGFGMECYLDVKRNTESDWFNWICSNSGWVILESVTEEKGYEEVVVKQGTTPDFWEE